jgi:F-type H+-transporting ATPase subunit delta
MADNNTIARPYAQAVFELARDAKALDAWSGALTTVRSLLADGVVAEYLSAPSLSNTERLEFLSGLVSSASEPASVLAGSDERGTNFLKLLLENRRLSVLPEISEHFEAFKADVENTIDVTITSAAALSDAQLATLVDALKARFGRDVNVKTQVDENLIGGAVIRAGDVVIDGSMRSSLQGLTSALIA